MSALTFTDSVLMEIWRLNPIIPVDPQRETLEDLKIGGFYIPAGTEVLTNYLQLREVKIFGGDQIFSNLGQKENLLLFET